MVRDAAICRVGRRRAIRNGMDMVLMGHLPRPRHLGKPRGATEDGSPWPESKCRETNSLGRFLMKRFGALLLLGATVNLSLSPTARSGVPKSSITRPGSVFTTKVDWFKRPPKGLALGSGTRLPYGLTVAVPAALRQEAASLLGGADTLSLKNEQAARFGVTSGGDSIC